ncbi:hypothetical protein KZX06_08975 [Micrococcus sp. EYE_162]|uniref:hypothetical protein n=1 Tax=unclassified Micrococcus TaxID=2620948 RepID=UPI0020039AB5|nr:MULTISPECIES: hypothetical protein [unclassified Micrococcus]MCK6096066.1 hypothetical protein [Micrococcus sp. EYE_212]MCK6172157.1 hypothetical protein [Micrococcus sp. EYE_162]
MPSHPSDAPRPKPSAAVYRRRRLVVGAALLLTLLMAAVAVGALIGRGSGVGGGEPAASDAASPSQSPAPSSSAPAESSSTAASPTEASSAPPSDAASASPTPDPALASATACEPSDLRLAAAVDKGRYHPGDEAQLRLGITNLSSTPCKLDVGTAQQEFTVRDAAGADVFSTRVCQQEPTHQDMLLDPHEEQSAVYRWDVRRSPSACGTPGADPAPGEHFLTVALGDLTSRPVSFQVRPSTSASASPSPSDSSTPLPAPSAAPSGTVSSPSGRAPASSPTTSARPTPTTRPPSPPASGRPAASSAGATSSATATPSR